ncbi:MAG: hypothetical protein JRF51_09865 [Deltaproteobacteria bacterium]|nr:hypothetical protein [Deltaproteobacteria bacterium]MBW2111093.1 hypothetical protein [Deltaproteobacteria bacterium]MBW2353515.1 hypothetical protein [Deltaproteobacteria bacterium]HDZ91204.1 hypothetical protein [Deltaproteobacteria bacterium]
MGEFLHYFPQALTFTNLITLILGVIGGLILGATPGLSPMRVMSRDQAIKMFQERQKYLEGLLKSLKKK